MIASKLRLLVRLSALPVLMGAVGFVHGQSSGSAQNGDQARNLHAGDVATFTVRLSGTDAAEFKFSSASLSLLGAVPPDQLASNHLADPTVTMPSPGVYLLTFKVGEHTYPGDYGLSVMFETKDGTLLLPWDSQSAGLATPVRIVNDHPLRRPTITIDGLQAEKTAELPPAAPVGATSAFTPADVAYMQGMIMHHGQAVDMCDMVRSHTTNPRIWELGRRIGVPQAKEIISMRDWLRSRGQSTAMAMPEAMPGMPDMDMQGNAMPQMPGMLTPAQMTALAQARGQDFDRLFLAGMIQHHGGALVMTNDLFASTRGGQEPQLYLFAKHVVLVQTAEINLMQSMQRDLGSPVTAVSLNQGFAPAK